MKYLILGANGMAGHIIAAYLTERGHEVIGFARKKSLCCSHTIIGDAMDLSRFRKRLASVPYDCVVNCIGVLNRAVDKDISRGIYLNSLLPHLAADILKDRDTKFIHISTDCVFSGKKGRYTEADIPDECSLYGRTKALGEVTEGRNLPFRTSIIGPELNKNGVGLFHWFMHQKGEIKGFTEAIWSGVTTLELAKAVEKAAFADLTGLYHLTNNETISKYDLLCLFNRLCRENCISIVPDSGLVCDKSMVCTREDFHYQIPSYEEMVKEMADWIVNHPDLYAGYKEHV